MITYNFAVEATGHSVTGYNRASHCNIKFGGKWVSGRRRYDASCVTHESIVVTRSFHGPSRSGRSHVGSFRRIFIPLIRRLYPRFTRDTLVANSLIQEAN